MNAQDDERMKFTGHERDLGVGWSAADDVDYMHARYYQAQVLPEPDGIPGGH